MWRPGLDQLRASFSDVDLRRGQRYAREGRVLWLERRESGHEQVLVGEIRGSRRTPYRVHVRAWLRDERWLVFRLIGAGGATLPRGFYVFSPEMPR